MPRYQISYEIDTDGEFETMSGETYLATWSQDIGWTRVPIDAEIVDITPPVEPAYELYADGTVIVTTSGMVYIKYGEKWFYPSTFSRTLGEGSEECEVNLRIQVEENNSAYVAYNPNEERGGITSFVHNGPV